MCTGDSNKQAAREYEPEASEGQIQTTLRRFIRLGLRYLAVPRLPMAYGTEGRVWPVLAEMISEP